MRIFRFAGIDVYLHWSWFVVAVFEINTRGHEYNLAIWNAAEYFALFAIVLTHEFGHALACRQTGGQADKIILWPLGGIAFVAPPQRPGATLWTIAAGPLVNVVLLPITFGFYVGANALGLETSSPDLVRFLKNLATLNGVLLIFNLLPIYPLDGGQILRSLLWFFLGRARSLMVASIIGFFGVAAVVALAIFTGDLLIAVMAVFIFSLCWRGLHHARQLMRIDSLPTHAGYSCPACQGVPPVGAFWGCHHCGRVFDTFATGGVCPGCQRQFPVTACVRCGAARPFEEWRQGPPPLPTNR